MAATKLNVPWLDGEPISKALSTSSDILHTLSHSEQWEVTDLSGLFEGVGHKRITYRRGHVGRP